MMRLQISKKQIESVLKLDGQARYEHSVKMIADTEEVFGLYSDGWALMSDGSQVVFPLWSSREYAETCAINELDGCKAKLISLEELFEDVLPTLKENRDGITIFPTPKSKGVVPDINRFIEDLKEELKNYE